ncbi:MAG: toll/interleukin-1 receptor domain-containing protein, partial [Candidatus Lokiarchaeota archaeon]|nr:toll/interleukin-1 receptor domain-containing protein [Candidatus Lokiarchaeota archaeon]
EKVRIKLEEKLAAVDNFIRENNFKLAYKNLGKVKAVSELYEFFDIFNRANKKVEICKEKEAGISERAIEEGIAPFVEKREETVITPVIGKEAEFKYNLFISYSTVDRDYFQIKKLVKELKKYPNINQVSYWERDSKANIVEFMDKTLEVSNTFILFCSENSLKSNAVKDEWQAAFQMRKQGLIKLIPVYEEQEHIPKLLWHLLNVKYNPDDFKGFVENLYKEILRG